MRFFAFALAISLTACGGAIDTNLLDGGLGDGSTSNDGTTTTDSSPKNDGGGQPTCVDLVNQLNTEQTAAEQCCPTCNSLQCTQQVDGLCCPVTVNSSDAQAVKTYLDTLDQIKNLKCAVNCPAITCSTKPTGICMQGGTCQQ